MAEKKETGRRTNNSSKIKTNRGPGKNVAKKRTTTRRKKGSTGQKRRVSRRNRRKTRIGLRIPGIILAIPLLAATGLIFIYTIFIFPGQLSNRIKDDLVEIYNPWIFEDSGSLVMIKLSSRPNQNLQQRAYNTVKEKYGLDVHFTRINSLQGRGINRLDFYKGPRKFTGLDKVYIYWNNSIITKEKNRDRGKPRKVEYDKIEHERRQERQDTTLHSRESTIRPSRYHETPGDSARIAVIIDDVGYRYNSIYDFLSLGFPVTFAIIPGLPDSKRFYRLIITNDYETIIHLPMEPDRGPRFVENNALLIGMSNSEIQSRVSSFINYFPEAIGANNHMGSRAVRDADIMNSMMQVLSRENLIWIDSMTTRATVSSEVASMTGVPCLERDVFLDNDKDYESIARAMDQLIIEARKKGSAIGIGHVQSSQLVNVLRDYHEKRGQLGIEFVPLSSLLSD
jgi:polysaccharide deacetylase 2 family uncharacterized protein YibQ